MSGDGKMTFLEHLEELRRRVINCILAVIGGMIVCWFFREELRAFLEAPLYEAWASVDGLPEPEPLRFTSLLEPFIAYLKLSAIGGIFLAAPVILYNLWRFISPGLYPKEKKVAIPFVLVSTLLFVGGSAMAYSIVFPIGFSFFLEFAAGGAIVEYEAEASLAASAASGDGPSRPALHPEDAGVATTGDLGPDGGQMDDARGGGDPDGGVNDVDAGAPTVLARASRPEPKRAVKPEGPAAASTSSSASPGEPRAPPKNASGEHAAKQDEKAEDAWWEILLDRFASEDCGSFEARATSDGAVALAFAWDAKRCDEAPPDLSKVKRNGEDVALEWKEVEGTEEGVLRFEAKDTPPETGAVAYEVFAVVDPHAAGKLAPMLMVQDYLSFAVRLLLAFGIVFELPILITFLALAGIVNYKQLLRFSRWFIVLAFVVAAILTPPDVITQVLLAMPLIVLYFLSVIVAYIFGPKVE